MNVITVIVRLILKGVCALVEVNVDAVLVFVRMVLKVMIAHAQMITQIV